MRGLRIRRLEVLFVLFLAAPAVADDNRLVVEQIGDDNRAGTWQGTPPSAADAGRAIGADPDTLSFAVRRAGSLGALEAGEGAGPLLSDTASLTDLIDEFEGLGGGSGNSATLVQEGARNRAIQVQAGGSNNRMLTEQYGSDNIAVHLQRGGDNNTELAQYGNDNETALIATGGATAEDGGALRMQSFGNVQGFAVRASGPQTYSTIDVRPNSTGGHDITLR